MQKSRTAWSSARSCKPTKRPRSTNSCVYNYWLCLPLPCHSRHWHYNSTPIDQQPRAAPPRKECRKFLCAHGRGKKKQMIRKMMNSDHDPERAHASVYPWSPAGTDSVGSRPPPPLPQQAAGSSSSSSEHCTLQCFWCSVLYQRELGPMIFTQTQQRPQQHFLWER